MNDGLVIIGEPHTATTAMAEIMQKACGCRMVPKSTCELLNPSTTLHPQRPLATVGPYCHALRVADVTSRPLIDLQNAVLDEARDRYGPAVVFKEVGFFTTMREWSRLRGVPLLIVACDPVRACVVQRRHRNSTMCYDFGLPRGILNRLRCALALQHRLFPQWEAEHGRSARVSIDQVIETPDEVSETLRNIGIECDCARHIGKAGRAKLKKVQGYARGEEYELLAELAPTLDTAGLEYKQANTRWRKD